MKKYLLRLLLILLAVCSMKTIFYVIDTKENRPVTSEIKYDKTLRQDIFSLMMAYPEAIIDMEVAEGDKIYLILKSGKKLLYDDRKDKTEEEKLQNPDLQDMMAQPYVLGPIGDLMARDHNPGRIRVYPLLKEVYGSNQHEIEKNLTNVKMHSTYHRFSKKNNASYHLANAMEELHHLAKNNPEIWSYIQPLGGTYNFRYISKTNRLSPHAFGIAIDLASHSHDYWQWSTRAQGSRRIKNYPKAIINVMERNYFIWGGKWGQFDIFHFEYRPEMIMKAQYFSNDKGKLWYENLPVENPKVSEIIWLIEDRLQDR